MNIDPRGMTVREAVVLTEDAVGTPGDVLPDGEGQLGKAALLELLHCAAADANEAMTIEGAYRACLARISAHTGWPLGQVYVTDRAARDRQSSSGIWHFAHPAGAERFKAFCALSGAAGFERGTDLAGRVLASGRPAWVADVTKDEHFSRVKLAREAGIVSALAMPVLVGSDVVRRLAKIT